MSETTTIDKVIVEEKPAPIEEEPTGSTPISIEDISTSNTISMSALLTVNDIMSTILIQKENNDRTILENIGNISNEELKEKLIYWAKLGFPAQFELIRVGVVSPTKCIDGVTRNLTEYIKYCSGKSIQDHVAILQSRLNGMVISCVESFGCFVITISKT